MHFLVGSLAKDDRASNPACNIRAQQAFKLALAFMDLPSSFFLVGSLTKGDLAFNPTYIVQAQSSMLRAQSFQTSL